MFEDEYQAHYIVSTMIFSILMFIAGLAILLYFSEKLVEGTVATSLTLGISAFFISVVFIGFDPENLALGSVATYEQAAGIALGSIFGAAMVAIALAFGITAIIAPMEFEEAPKKVVLVPLAAVALAGILSLDGLLSRLDGIILLGSFVFALWYLFKLSLSGVDIKAGGEVAEVLEKKEKGKEIKSWKGIVLMFASLVAIIAGSEMVVQSSETLLAGVGISETVFGMTILALLVSIEELARELPAALKGRPDISYGNVAGSVLAFFLFNAGIIALINPVPISNEVIYFHIPFCILTVIFISYCMLKKSISRWQGVTLLIIYTLFFGGSFLL